jgi:hypothetical protein
MTENKNRGFSRQLIVRKVHVWVQKSQTVWLFVWLFWLSVWNHGNPLKSVTIVKLFSPFLINFRVLLKNFEIGENNFTVFIQFPCFWVKKTRFVWLQKFAFVWLLSVSGLTLRLLCLSLVWVLKKSQTLWHDSRFTTYRSHTGHHTPRPMSHSSVRLKPPVLMTTINPIEILHQYLNR